MNRRSMRFRLTAWYSAILLVSLGAFGSLSWFAVRHVLFQSVDVELASRVEGIRRFIEAHNDSPSIEEIRDEFKEHSVVAPGGDLFQVCDARGVWLYRSVDLEAGSVPIVLPAALPGAGVFEQRAVNGAMLRFFSRPVEALGQPYTVQVAASVHELLHGLAMFGWTLLLSAPLVWLIAFCGGWWMSRRALQPVDHIIATARSIGERSLSRRLPVPAADDELRRLSETLNQMLARIEGAFHRVAEFTADASHELRTPVALIRTTAELALRKDRTSGDYQQALADIHAESVRTTQLIEDLLTLARADAGKLSLDRREVDLSALVSEACAQGEKLAASKSLAFHSDLPRHPVPALADAASLRRALLILLDNAIKYTSAGHVTVRLANHASTARIEITDTGVGIGPDDLPRIFERFYRAEKSRSRDSGGVGLGLSIALWIVEAHNGSIEVDSRPDRGSTFSVLLPQTTPS